MTPKLIKVWALPVRLIHWTLVTAVCVAWYWSGSIFDEMNHVYAGYVAGFLIVSKWIYGSVVRDFSGFNHFPPNPPAAGEYLLDLFKGRARRYLGHNPAGAMAIYAMLILGTSTVLTGALAFEQSNLLLEYEQWGEVHNFLAYAWLYFIILHVTGVLVGSYMHKENLIKSMITGYKRRRLNCTTPIFERVDNILSEKISETLRLRYIEEAAYYLAEKRGWNRGFNWDDWMEAEKQINEMLKGRQ